MRNLFLIALLFIIGINANAQISLPKDLGEGEVIIGTYWFPPADTANMDTTHHGFMQFHYHINHDKVFRKGNIDSSLILTSKTRNTHDNVTVTSHFSAWLQIPTYLIDWSEKTIYAYHDIGSKNATITKGPLKTDTQDAIYRGILLADTCTIKISIDTTHQERVITAGMVSYKALYKDPRQKNWHQFIYTKQILPFFPPLNFGCPYSFPFTVISYDGESPGTAKGKVVIGIFRAQIISLSGAEQDHSFFELPANIPIKISGGY